MGNVDRWSWETKRGQSSYCSVIAIGKEEGTRREFHPDKRSPREYRDAPVYPELKLFTWDLQSKNCMSSVPVQHLYWERLMIEYRWLRTLTWGDHFPRVCSSPERVFFIVRRYLFCPRSQVTLSFRQFSRGRLLVPHHVMNELYH